MEDDTARLTYLEGLIRNCPHAEISFNEDSDVEDKNGWVPIGFRIRVEGCETTDVCAPTLRQVIDIDFALETGRGKA